MNEREKIELICRFLTVKGKGNMQGNKLAYAIGPLRDRDEVYEKLSEFLDGEQVKELENKESVFDTVKSKFEVRWMFSAQPDYPQELISFLKNATPPVLSYIGNIDLLRKRKVGFSGSRKVSEKGLGITKDCVGQLVARDVCIISGYAKGVDMEAHQVALESGGSTIFVLPEGINSFRIKKELKEFWDWERVLVISEFRPTDMWMASRAMQRNGSIIGLSDVMVVVEAGETGGSLAAGERTMGAGRSLFVPLYGEVPESARGNSILIEKGAFPICRSKESGRANLSKMFELLDERNKYELF
ncbi:MAG: DNA-protecting protein DprA [Bacteroides sp.]|nr:DNA-protecting protein DprA [Bacteroides sp.]